MRIVRNENMEREVVLTTKELAERWKCSTGTIVNMVNSGRLKRIKGCNKPYKFSLDYIEHYEVGDENVSMLDSKRKDRLIQSLQEENKMLKAYINEFKALAQQVL